MTPINTPPFRLPKIDPVSMAFGTSYSVSVPLAVMRVTAFFLPNQNESSMAVVISPVIWPAPALK